MDHLDGPLGRPDDLLVAMGYLLFYTLVITYPCDNPNIGLALYLFVKEAPHFRLDIRINNSWKC